MAEIIDEVLCPMLSENIDIGYCIELQMIADNEVKPTQDEENLTKEDFEICYNCKKRIDPSL